MALQWTAMVSLAFGTGGLERRQLVEQPSCQQLQHLAGSSTG